MFKYLSLLITTALVANEIPQHIIDIGTKASKDLQIKLSSKLKKEFKTNGLISAAAFCNENAYILTQDVNLHQVQGVSIKRISLKERSPLNITLEDEKIVLQTMQKMIKQKRLPPYIITQQKGIYKYYKPLIISKPLCLKCHGDLSSNKELSTFIKKYYPLDKAIMYKMGELRGAVVVEIRP